MLRLIYKNRGLNLGLLLFLEKSLKDINQIIMINKF